MNTDWKDALASAGASFDETGVAYFTSIESDLKSAKDSTVMTDLSTLGIIRAQGEESLDFLQNQLSNDLRLVSENQSQLSGYCSAKGRMMADFRIFQQSGTFYLTIQHGLLENTLKRLRMFILRSKVTLDNASNELCGIGLAGPNAEQALENAGLPVPAVSNDSSLQNNISVIRIDSSPMFEIYGPVESMLSLWQALSSQATPVGYHAWNWLNIQIGIPQIRSETVEAFVPQMVNFHSIGGVSFKKGCYPGQEVVARMHYLGKLKRRMYHAWVESNAAIQAGDNLYSSKQDEQPVGKVVYAEPSPAGGYDLLAVLQIASVESGSIHLVDFQGPSLDFKDLPYEVTNEA